VIAGTPFSILRNKNQKKEYKPTNLFSSDSQTRIPQDIGSLLNEFYVQDFNPKMRASFYSLKSRAESRDSRQPTLSQAGSGQNTAIKVKPVVSGEGPIKAVVMRGEETPNAPPRPIRKLKVTPVGSSSSKKLKLRTSQ